MTSDSKKATTRRDFFRSLGRGTALAVVAGGGAILAVCRGGGWSADRCAGGGLCASCRLLNGCDLPKAVSARLGHEDR